MSSEPLVIQYTKLLHKCGGVDAPPVQAFRKKHADDAVFQRRAAKLDELFVLKQTLEKDGRSHSAA